MGEVLLIEILYFRVSPSNERIIKVDNTWLGGNASRSVEGEATFSPLQSQQLTSITRFIVAILIIHQGLTCLYITLHCYIIK